MARGARRLAPGIRVLHVQLPALALPELLRILRHRDRPWPPGERAHPGELQPTVSGTDHSRVLDSLAHHTLELDSRAPVLSAGALRPHRPGSHARTPGRGGLRRHHVPTHRRLARTEA